MSGILKNTSSYHEEFIESLKKPRAANLYLRIAMEEYHQDSDVEALLLALHNIAEAKGGISQLAQKTHLNPQNLYNIFSKKGNPTLNTFELILKRVRVPLSNTARNEKISLIYHSADLKPTL